MENLCCFLGWLVTVEAQRPLRRGSNIWRNLLIPLAGAKSVLRVVFESKPVNQAGLHLGQLLR